MLLAGARGGTAEAIANVLHQPVASHSYHVAVAALAKYLIKGANQGSNELSVANALWVERGASLESGFEAILRDAYRAPLTRLDFASPEPACAKINSWTAEHTKNRIRTMLSASSIHPDTRLLLTSAIYFYGKWSWPFEPTYTYQDAFRPLRGGAVTANFMLQQASVGYTETRSLQILEMPYDGIPMAFDILLPKAPDGLADLERTLNFQTLASHFSTLSQEKVLIAIPKFRAESSTALKGALSRMGMGEAFSEKADFSGIDGRRDLFVTDALHKAFVDISEQGTEAAAATGVKYGSADRLAKIFCWADHRFVFLIRDTTSGVILFAGRFLRP